MKNIASFCGFPPLPPSLSTEPCSAVMATIGPSLCDVDQIQEAMIAGCRWFRLPFGYRQRNHLESAMIIKKVGVHLGYPPIIVADLPSGRPRLAQGSNNKITISSTVCFVDATLHKDIPGLRVDGLNNQIIDTIDLYHKVLMLDGRIELKVISKSDGYILCQVLSGEGVVKEGNSLSFPETSCRYPTVLNDDLAILKVMQAKDCPADYVIFSLISDDEDIRLGANTLKLNGLSPKIIAKIETKKAAENTQSICTFVDAVLLGRGDLGLSVCISSIPSIQEHVINQSKIHGIPCFVGTQFLESFSDTGQMERNEASAISEAFRLGASGIMLGKETVFSKYPIQSIKAVLDAHRNHWMRSQVWIHTARKHNNKRIFAIEGPNGAGKSSVIDRLTKLRKFHLLRGVPPEYEEPQLKTNILSSPSWMAATMFYLSGSMEMNRYLPEIGPVLIDRSVWSTPAVQAAFDPTRLPDVFAAMGLASQWLLFPDVTIYLDVHHDICLSRSSSKSAIEKSWDSAGPKGVEAHIRERDFFIWLQCCGVPIVIVDGNGSVDQVAEHILEAMEI